MSLEDPINEAESHPAYPGRHNGTCIVAGAAWTLQDDLLRALELRPAAKIFGVNRAARVQRCDFLTAVDRQNAAGYRRDQDVGFGAGGYTFHAWKPKGTDSEADYPAVDYWWPKLWVGGTTSWFAARVARAMGFDEIILCGVMFEPGPHCDNSPAPAFDSGAWRSVLNMRNAVERDRAMHPHVRAMNGWPRELLGAPE